MGIHRQRDEMIENLYSTLLDTKGFTVYSETDMLTWRHFTYSEGWGVSIEGSETVVSEHALTLPVFNALVREYHRLQQEVDGSFVGVWYDVENAKVYFDITVIYDTERQAVYEAIEAGQVAYFDYAKMEVVKVSEVAASTVYDDADDCNPREGVGFGTTEQRIEEEGQGYGVGQGVGTPGTYWSKPQKRT